jgi:hypothetical protein
MEVVAVAPQRNEVDQRLQAPDNNAPVVPNEVCIYSRMLLHYVQHHVSYTLNAKH